MSDTDKDYTDLVQENPAARLQKIHVKLKGCSAICIDLDRSQVRQISDKLRQMKEDLLFLMILVLSYLHIVNNQTSACSSSLSFFISFSFFSIHRKSVTPNSEQINS